MAVEQPRQRKAQRLQARPGCLQASFLVDGGELEAQVELIQLSHAVILAGWCEARGLGSSAVADRPADTPQQRERTPAVAPPRDRGDQARQIVLGALVALAVVFSLLNFHKVKVDFIFHSYHWPLIIVIVGCIALGAAIDRLWIRYAARLRKR
jgi:uncharacterized integral membrane protein